MLPPPSTVLLLVFAATLHLPWLFFNTLRRILLPLIYVSNQSTASQGGEETAHSDDLAAALAGEAAAKEHAAILQKTLDASVELCKRAEAAWESRHEDHCKEVRTTMMAPLTSAV